MLPCVFLGDVIVLGKSDVFKFNFPTEAAKLREKRRSGFYSTVSLIDHLTVLCSVARPWNESEAGVDHALTQTSLLFLCKSRNANEFLFT